MTLRNHLYPKLIKLGFLFSLILSFPVFISSQSRQDKFEQEQQREETAKELPPDFKILNSTSSYLEIEFTPQFEGDYDFVNGVSRNEKIGFPDVKFRAFPIFLPSGNIGIVEVLDSKFEDVQNTDVAPVPTRERSKDLKDINPVFIKDHKAYSQNRFYPQNNADGIFIGTIRNKYFGYLNVYPVQYNPASRQLRKYSYLRVRITFTGSPLQANKSLSYEERNFFRSTALNGEIAMNWSTPEFNSMGDSQITNSIFASGDFYKIEVKETGIYKLDKNTLTNAGIDLTNVDPRTIKIYGNGGYELPYNNSIPVPFDPVENRIYIEGESDGVFNDGDYILFYGRSPHGWIYDTSRATYSHKVHTFSISNYYFITYNGSNGLRIEQKISPNNPNINPLPYFKEKIFEEPEVNNLGSTGYLWLSHRIGVNESFSINKELKGYVDGSNINFRFRMGNASSSPAYFKLEDANSNYTSTQFVSQISGFAHVILSYINNDNYGITYPLLPGKTGINFKASLPTSLGNSSNVAGYYDYYEVHYNRYFNADGDVLSFTSPDTNGILEYRINNFSSQDVKLFDVTEYADVKLITPSSFSNGTLTFQDSYVAGAPKEYIATGGNNFKTPASISAKIPNQNIKGDFAEGASFIILTPKEFLTAAERLKAQREIQGNNYIKTVVIEVEKIYNEFSSGILNPVAIRNFLKYTYNNWAERPVYVMFMGDGSYDYKNIYGLYNSNLKNWLPPIEVTSEYADEVASYCSDDFIVEVTESSIQPVSQIAIDFAPGRTCVNSLTDANTVVDKIIAYESPANFGKWKNKIMYVGDDGWTTENTGGQEGAIHTNQCEDLAENHTAKHFEKEKIYIVTYPSIITPQGRRKPGANVDIIKGWNEGRLVINYTGHGSTDLWAHERVFDRQISIPQLTNVNKYPFVTIASCDLARWDDPFFISAGEQLVNEVNRGAIGLIAATRPVYSGQNATFNNRLWDNFIFKKDTLHLPIRIGLAMYNVKQQLFSDNDLKFSLICDPTVRVGIPQYFTKIDSINNIPGGKIAQMKALQKVNISGSILRPDSTFWNDYNGEIDIKVFDVDKYINFIDFGYSFSFRREGGIIYSGKTNVTNGLWNVEFIVPKDISYSPGNGKIIAYFKNGQSDGVGYSGNFIMSGIDTTAVADTVGPDLNVFLNSRSFRPGDMVNQKPKLIVDFFDEHGINLTGTIGHKIEAVLNNDEDHKLDLTPFYQTVSGYQRGLLEYQFDNLPTGKNTLEIRAWDTYNNPSSKMVDFNVINSSELAIENIFNYPNPMRDETSFTFNHNLDEPLTAEVKIYTVSGRLIKELNKTNITDKFVNLNWDGRDSDGDEIANGTYIFKIIIKSDDGKFSKSSVGKLAKLK